MNEFLVKFWKFFRDDNSSRNEMIVEIPKIRVIMLFRGYYYSYYLYF